MYIIGNKIREDTDGCVWQYIFTNYINVLSILYHYFKIVIDKKIGAPSYGNNVVGGLN